MSKNAQWMGLTLACALASSAAWAQTPKMAAPAGGAPGAVQASAPVVQAAVIQAPQAQTPPMASPASQPTAAADGGSFSRRETMRRINENKARLELLKSQSDLDKFEKGSSGEGSRKDDASGLQAALEQVKKEQAPSAPVAAIEQGPSVSLLSTFSMVSTPQGGYAELKVGDLVVHKKVGDRLPSGDYVRAINFDSIEVSKSKTAKKTRTIYITASDTASVYASRGRSGQSIEAAPAPASPSGLPPMPGSR